MVESHGLRSYRFRPISSSQSPEEARSFIGRLRRALRAAHGLGIPVSLRWSSDAAGPVCITVPDGVGTRWIQFGLSAAYELGQWQAVDRSESWGRGRATLRIFSGASSELPFPAPLDEAPWCETVLAELSSEHASVAVEWELQPSPNGPSIEHRVEELVPPGSRVVDLRSRSLPERILQDRQEARRTALRWRAKGQISIDPGKKGLDAAFRIGHLIESASHLDGGNRFVSCRAGTPQSLFRSATVLSEAELVGLFPPPTFPSSLSPAKDSPGRGRLWLGRDLRGTSLGLPVDSTQGRHLLVLGETGMGKSSLVVRLGWQAARWGSVILFDPIGDTAREFLAGLPESHAPRVSWLTPAQPGLTLSVLKEVAGTGEGNSARRDRLLADVVGALRRVRAGRYSDSSYWGPRLEEMLFQSLRAASYWPNSSLTLAERLLTPGGFGFRAVPECAREAVGDVRRRVDSSPQDGEGARRLLSEVTRSPLLRELLDSPSPTWSVPSAVSAGQTTVISGDAPAVGESVARFLLATVLALVWNAVLDRGGSAKTFLILDEAQWYAHEGVAEMLRLGRRFNLHVWAATQSLSSLPESVREAFVTNSADLVLFRGDPRDAREVARWVSLIAPDRLMRLCKGEAVVLVDKGAEVRWIQLPRPLPTSGSPERFVPSTATRPEPLLEAAPAGRVVVPSKEDSLSPTEPQPSGATPLIQALREVLHREGDGPELTVRLSDLRSKCSTDPAAAERWVRSGGRLLSSSGAMLWAGRDDSGSFWVLSRDRLADVLSEKGSTSTGAPIS